MKANDTEASHGTAVRRRFHQHHRRRRQGIRAEAEDLEVSILKSVEENGEEFLEAIEDDAELEAVYSALMDLIYEDEEEPEA